MSWKIGERIRDLRTGRNLTQEQVAEKLNMSRQKYARIENGINDISLTVLKQVADIFCVSVGDITKVIDDPPQMDFRMGECENASLENVFEMLDLFYANKQAYRKWHD